MLFSFLPFFPSFFLNIITLKYLDDFGLCDAWPGESQFPVYMDFVGIVKYLSAPKASQASTVPQSEYTEIQKWQHCVSASEQNILAWDTATCLSLTLM